MKTIRRMLLLILLIAGLMKTALPQQDSLEQSRIAWNRTLLTSDIFIREHTAFLSQAIQDIPPGKALDVAMGEGRNALFLARHGWETTGFDIANEALDSAQATARKEHLVIKTVLASRDEFDFGINQWDLIAVMYADIICGGCCAYDKAFIATIKKALKPGGRIVYEWFTREGLLAVQPSVENQSSWGCEENTIRDAFLDVGGFRIIHYAEALGIPDWDPSKRFRPIKMIYFIAEKMESEREH